MTRGSRPLQTGLPMDAVGGVGLHGLNRVVGTEARMIRLDPVTCVNQGVLTGDSMMESKF